jgi:hypothetical protein
VCFVRCDSHMSARFDLKSGLTNQRECLQGNVTITLVRPASPLAAKRLTVECGADFEVKNNPTDLGFRS